MFKRFELSHPISGSQAPGNLSLETIDKAREALLREVESRHYHFKTVEQSILDHRPTPVPAPPPIRQCIAENVHGSLYRHRFAMPAAFADSYLGFAKAALQRGDMEQAAQAIERILRVDPLSPPANALLAEIGERGAEGLALRLRKRFHLRHLKSFGHRKLAVPTRLAIHARSGSILVSDVQQPHISVFSFSGRLKATFDLKLSTAVGLSADGADSFWVCDLGNQRLVRFDMKGRIIETIAVRPQDASLGERMPGVVQRLGQDRFVLLAGDKSLERIWLGELTPEGFIQGADLPETVMFMKVVDGKIIFRGHNTGQLYCMDALGEVPRVIPLAMPRLATNYGFAPSRQGWFMDFSGALLAKFTAQGALAFTVDLQKMFGQSTYVMDMEAVEHNGRELLCVADMGNKCVHVLEVAEKAADHEQA